MTDPSDDLDALRALISHRYVVEILDAVASSPRTFRQLTATVGPHHAIEAALRILASHRLIETDQHGSWDRRPVGATCIQLTDRGRYTVSTLSSLAVWTALYERTDHGHRDRSN
ncbi:hypothetical protein [Nocardia aurantiaca]|uniref:HTH hxlR-type domain-containing protein n=1 Tax=Nocardia aurantiaca TaxID=2675850 RepID=A0A6I3L6A9_9NOCA|nr:hypothetical protein [Nocardia aurantiaca]MTE16204.1 hypothetical protein [Nocardia aurantiaca]